MYLVVKIFPFPTSQFCFSESFPIRACCVSRHVREAKMRSLFSENFSVKEHNIYLKLLQSVSFSSIFHEKSLQSLAWRLAKASSRTYRVSFLASPLPHSIALCSTHMSPVWGVNWPLPHCRKPHFESVEASSTVSSPTVYSPTPHLLEILFVEVIYLYSFFVLLL